MDTERSMGRSRRCTTALTDEHLNEQSCIANSQARLNERAMQQRVTASSTKHQRPVVTAHRACMARGTTTDAALLAVVGYWFVV